MEFWGVEVKAGEPFKVEPEAGMVIHVSQACLGETKNKGTESIILSVKIDDKKFVLGNLSLDKIPQLTCDLVFEKDFVLSHTWKHGIVSLTIMPLLCTEGDDFDDFDDDSDEEADVPQIALQNEKYSRGVKPYFYTDMADGDGDEDSDEEDDEETPKKAELGKKRTNESAVKTPVPAKKAKGAASPKSEGKKGGHTATPHPAKNAGKTPATGDKSKGQQTPKSGGKSGGISCKSCSKTFASDKALESHSKAKHG
ncbi:hypothetical protein TIFTF001_025344 [Ficus carica]|uniref:C2H2-type domain-containing protein n=1 Tax=Ficus carica TaxID=3494 RepID=A0AA88AR11_FICCA|nr:hypothetical protein TIFTF001_025344 [Ficus carica]